jgi:hypothetical protein
VNQVSEVESDMFLRKVGLPSNGLHGVIFQKIELIITTGV